MIRSMTGYARAETTGPWGRMAWELRSVNHRYLDLQLKVPEDFRALEADLRQVAQARVARGKVEASLRFSMEAAASAAIEIDPARLSALCAAVDAVSAAAGKTTAPDPARLLAWPGVVREDARDMAPLLPVAAKLFEQALADFTATREREGARMATYLRERSAALEDLVARVRARLPEVREQWLVRVRARCRELGTEVEPARLEQEVVLAAQRIDVDEEMSRLLSHVVEVRQVLARDEAIGRRLDFLMQELNREANTLSSKSQDADMTRWAVDMKVLIEQMREQVQNVE